MATDPGGEESLRYAAPVGDPPDQYRPRQAPDAGPHPAAPDVVEVGSALLATPGLVVLHSGPGGGRSSTLARLGTAFRGPVFAGGGLASLPAEPGFALARAVRVRLPAHDPALLAEAVRSRVRAGLLLLDDLQWADPATLAALVPLATHCRVAVALRTPHRLPSAAVDALRAAATGWLAVPPLDPAAATALVGRVAPALPPTAVAEVVRRAGGVPLAVTTLARRAVAREIRPDDGRARSTPPALDVDQVGYAVATALADLTRPARTAMAALGLLGRPADRRLLGAGVDELAAAGLVTVDPAAGGPVVAAVSPYVAEVAAGLLDDPGRRALHRRIADLVPAPEAVRHLAAAGDSVDAYRRAVAATATADTVGERADLLLTACGLPDVDPEPPVRLAAAQAALDCGRPRAAARVLTTATPLGVAPDLLRAEALVQLGDLASAAAVVARIPDSATPDQRAARDRITLLVQLGTDPDAATRTATDLVARYGPEPAHPGLRAALAAVRAAGRAPGWETGLASAAAATGAAGDPLSARWAAWLLVETLLADGRLVEAGQAAEAAERACAVDLAYSWQTRFLAARLWCAALRGGLPALSADEAARRAADLTDRTLPGAARGYATAAAGLAEADGGLLGPARARLARVTDRAGAAGALLDWVGREAAWLDGQPEHAVGGPADGSTLVDGLRRITAHWAAYDTRRPAGPDAPPGDDAGAGPPAGSGDDAGVDIGGPAGPPAPVRRTLAAWTTPGGDPAGFTRAATDWRDLAVREEVRCLLAAGLHDPDPTRGVATLLAAEERAEQAGLVVLLGRTRRALRRHAVRRDRRGGRTDGDLTDREREVLRLVAAGEPTRRIAGRLGISGETVETHVRSGMRKLGARTRTEAAALALEMR
ncbi:LuxR C-terminal-related transcriptional regulator [Plantactinospora sp. B24E8]|uniref:helix-turn-helix transcriptional regulator n=1 Tax=Plantactinospora sp. B24E8 TaxID=3153567 RepID=UPI00325F420E